MTTQENDSVDAKRAVLRPLLAGNAAHDYANAYATALQWNEAFKAELAAALEKPLNDHILATPQDTLVDMRHLATAVNAALRQLGLAVRCPKTGDPSWLLAEPKSGEADVYRYRFQSTDRSGRLNRHAPCMSLPELSLVALPPRGESLARKFYGPGDAPGRI